MIWNMNAHEKITDDAFKFIKAHKVELIEKFVQGNKPPADVLPTTVFMAGCPGAGKTEFSKRLIEKLGAAVRIDADEIREFCPGYTGDNAHLFQKAASKGVNMLYDYVLLNKINAIMDGTFAYSEAIQNIERSLKKGRTTEIMFVLSRSSTGLGIYKKKRRIRKKTCYQRNLC